MENFNGCQMPCLPNIAEGKAEFDQQSLEKRFKRGLARPWNYYIKKNLKSLLVLFKSWNGKVSHNKEVNVAKENKSGVIHLQIGDWVRVRSFEEIQSTLGSFNELKGCAFLDYMKEYCGTEQRVFKVLERFLDERDYQVKKVKGVVLLEGVFCQGTPVFGRCDRSCLLFWREEWLEKIDKSS
jgi:hypothetical protein